MHPHDPIQRSVYLPLSTLDKCAICQKTQGLHLCSSCNERIYCSPNCQKADWTNHKLHCGKTEKIDLATFYPFLAGLSEQSHLNPNKPNPPALAHKILNSPNPYCPITPSTYLSLPPSKYSRDNASKFLLLGPEIHPILGGGAEWWPTADSDKVRSKLMRRIVRSGYALPILTAICISILAEIYTTTSGKTLSCSCPNPNADKEGKEGGIRKRLRYRSSPIADFGIAIGSASVTSQDRLTYKFSKDNTILPGQDPTEHYWIYFSTIRGEEVHLDTFMFTHNMCLMVATSPYMPPGSMAVLPEYVPAAFEDRLHRKLTPDLRKERTRFSVLRDEGLHEAVRNSLEGFYDSDVTKIESFMSKILSHPATSPTGTPRTLTPTESNLCLSLATQNCDCFPWAIAYPHNRWKKWPDSERIRMGIEQDPGELDYLDEDSEDWNRYMKRAIKKAKGRTFSRDELGELYKEWREKKELETGREL
ncbi:hypothetical protein JAAARDRAFT_468726 [Jaapia argillacea MUCL 33604]|uniref:MYND-type domain-containing protein n=1 Tax=Jaapia argillacea MUCL 33604 TaxID=933084 RepID=A0A067Q6M0_9AGAM|nr:hypothetical protein JAAARDRAFT_468726 [Jaapia argillacea MUCL 33604]